MAEINAVCSICGTRVHLTQAVGDTKCPICFQTVDAAECRAAFNELVPTKGETEPSDDELIAELSKSLPDKEASPQNNDLSARQQGDEKKKSRGTAKKEKRQLTPFELAAKKRGNRIFARHMILCDLILALWLALDFVLVFFGLRDGRSQVFQAFMRREFGFANFFGGDNGEGELAMIIAGIIAIIVAIALFNVMKDTDAGWVVAVILGILSFLLARLIIALLGEIASFTLSPYPLLIFGALCIVFTLKASKSLPRHKKLVRITHVIFTVAVTAALFPMAYFLHNGGTLADYIAQLRLCILPFFAALTV